ncbi:GntR family transcriptional regulator [Fluviibacterium sp. DFM31]|uniref:GntR family transcriptional regulator n=1 Tax=Meridianimarinicoccus marinus TaxID=3231483 RepID=A0ABV3LB70_9RHOB
MAEPLYIRVLHALVSAMAAGDLLPGDRLMENRIANQFGVSRAPSRQALGELETLGLVTHAEPPARGYVVADGAAQYAAQIAIPKSEPFNTQITPSWQLIYSEVEEALTRLIAFGEWRLVETDLGQHFGVSRTVVREVLARLQSRGLVVNEGKGWVAPELSQTRVRELYEVRSLLEPAALMDVGGSPPEQLVGQMIADLHSVMNNSSGAPTLDKLEADLHLGLLGRCRNSALKKAMTEAQSLLLAHRFFYQHTADIFPVEPFLDEHLLVLDALRTGAISDACKGLRQHLLSSSDRAAARISNLRDTFRDTPPKYLEPIDQLS